MVREYLEQDVYEALQQRLRFLFEEFDNIYISFSGGKDSGLLLNLLLDFRNKQYPDREIVVFHQDFEAQYTVTTEYIAVSYTHLSHFIKIRKLCMERYAGRMLLCFST